MTPRIDLQPADVPMLLKRGDDMKPWTATFKDRNFSTAGGYTWFCRILSGATVVKALTVTAVYAGTDTVVTVSGLTAAESSALATSGLTYDFGHSAPIRTTYFAGGVRCD